jgi:hypothetical protein
VNPKLLEFVVKHYEYFLIRRGKERKEREGEVRRRENMYLSAITKLILTRD